MNIFPLKRPRDGNAQKWQFSAHEPAQENEIYHLQSCSGRGVTVVGASVKVCTVSDINPIVERGAYFESRASCCQGGLP